MDFLNNGKILTNDNSSITLDSFSKILKRINFSVRSGQTFSNDIISTYSLVYTTDSAYAGGILSLNDTIHLIPFSANVGQKIDS
mgnify:CR=1 FL=1